MKRKLLLLFLGFILIYYLVHIAADLPGFVNGNPGFVLLPRNFMDRLLEIGANFLFALFIYLILYKWYPVRHYVMIVTGILLSLALVFYLNYGTYRFNTSGSIRLRFYFLQNIFFFCIYSLYGIVFYFIRYSHYKELERTELLLQNRQSELSFLRSQINPHFLFNSLNNIYSLVYEGSKQALPAIAGLSELLRYMLYDTTEKVPLEKELDYIRRYIDLQKLRFDHPVKTDLVISGQTAGIAIPPLLLVPFIENAFKHGDFSENGKGLMVFIENTTRKTRFHCHNAKSNGMKDAGGGIGLGNVKRRLELLYAGKHQLEISEDQHTFTINLELLHE